jgi:hypothetical protein
MVILQADPYTFTSHKSDNLNDNFLDRHVNFFKLARIKGPKVLIKQPEFLTIMDGKLGRNYLANNIARSITRNRRLNLFVRKRKPVLKKSSIEVSKRVSLQLDVKNLYDKALLYYFERLLKECRDNNIIVITVQYPMYDKYIKYSKAYIDPDEFMSRIVENPDYKKYIYKNLNYFYYYIDNDNYFMDGDHLNKRGRSDFTKVIDEEIATILSELP